MVNASASGQLAAQTIELLDKSPRFDRINQQLREAVPMNKAAMSEFFECNRRNLSEYGAEGELYRYVELKHWSDQWLSILAGQTSSFCGGPHAGEANWRYRSWNLTFGQEVSLWSWFQTNYFSTAEKELDYARVHGKLKVAVIRNHPCGDIANDVYALHLYKSGVVFRLVSDQPECMGVQTEISYRRLSTFLNKTGKSAIRPMM